MVRYIWVVALVLVLSISSIALAKNPYWDDFLETASLKYDYGHGQFTYLVKTLEYDQDAFIKNGLDTELEIRLGVLKNTELYTYALSADEYLNIVTELKYEFLHNKYLTATGMGRLFYVRKDFTTPSAKLMLDFNILPTLQATSILQLYFYTNGNIAKGLDSSVNFQLTPKDTFRSKFKLFFIESQMMFDFRMAYQHTINQQAAYIAYTYFDANNVHLENVLEYTPIPQLKISGNLIINTGEMQNDYDTGELKNNLRNWINMKVEGKISPEVSTIIEYMKEADPKGYSYIKASVNFKI